MGKFRFSDHTHAKLANPANTLDSQGYPAANNLLKFANVAGEIQKSWGTLAIVSNTLAAQGPFKINNLSNISDISRGQSINQENERPNIPPAQPAGMGPEYEKLWTDAWTLTDQIDDFRNGIAIEDRRAMLPELDIMRAELSQLESLGAHLPVRAIEQVKQPEIPKVQETNPDTCPAQCKVSGRCYGLAYFLGKSGKSQNCIKPCPYSDKFKTWI